MSDNNKKPDQKSEADRKAAEVRAENQKPQDAQRDQKPADASATK